jgi:hypothetical protein
MRTTETCASAAETRGSAAEMAATTAKMTATTAEMAASTAKMATTTAAAEMATTTTAARSRKGEVSSKKYHRAKRNACREYFKNLGCHTHAHVNLFLNCKFSHMDIALWGSMDRTEGRQEI